MSSIDPSLPSSSSAPIPLTVRGARRFLRFVCTSNPFYVISAALFLFGLRLSFAKPASEIDNWALMGGLAGYTLLLAGAALLLVRLARIWNDVRTVLLLVILMFLATSVTFDEVLVLKPERGQWLFIGGFVFSVALTEGLLRGIRLRLPALYRIPYHLTLALFFLYPLVLEPVVHEPHSEELMWGLWGFAPAAGLVFLTLIPAIRRGRDHLRDNGSPWPWPFYPWSVFVFLAAAVCGRAFLVCWSFHLLPGVDEQLVFGPFFLVPFGLALAVLVLEIGIVERSRWTRLVAMIAPAALVPVAAIGHRPDAVYWQFLDHFAERLGGTPLFVTLLATGGFYVYAALRGISLAAEGITFVLVALAFVTPETLTLREVETPRVPFLLGAVAVQVVVGIARRDAWRLAVGAAGACVWLGSILVRVYRELREEVAGLDYLVVGLVLLPVAILISLAKGGALTRPAAPRNEPARE